MATTIDDEGWLPFLKKPDKEFVGKLLEKEGYREQPNIHDRKQWRAYWEACARICAEHQIPIAAGLSDDAATD